MYFPADPYGNRSVHESRQRSKKGDVEMNFVDEEDSLEANLYQSILNEIYCGHLVGGQRLKVSELATRFKVSTSPVREVLRRMQGEGLVEISPNRGAIVKPFDSTEIQNVFEVLEMLTPYFNVWFARYARPEMVEEVAAVQEQIRALDTNDITLFKRLDSEFHWIVCKHHYNTVAAETWKKLRTSLGVHGSSLPISTDRYRVIVAEHDELVAAFRENDPQKADEIIRRHLSGSVVEMQQQMRALGK